MSVDQCIQPLPMSVDNSLDSLHGRYVVDSFAAHALKMAQSATCILEPSVERMDLYHESDSTC
jgi:hypothetical protein